MKAFKIVVTGPFNAGKTTLIKTLCGRILESDRRLLVETVKPTTTALSISGCWSSMRSA